MEKFMFIHESGFRRMGDEAYLDMVVDLPEKFHDQKKKDLARYFFMSHASGDIHHGEDHCVRLMLHIFFERAELRSWLYRGMNPLLPWADLREESSRTEKSPVRG